MNCIIVDDDAMARKSIEQMIKATEFLELKESFSSPVKAFQYLQENTVDLLFLDIEMPEMTGLEMLANIKAQPSVVFTTGKKEYVLEVFSHKAIDYLIKPIEYPKFLKAVLKAKDLNKKVDERTVACWDFVLIRSEGIFYKTYYKDIVFIEALGDYININTTGKKLIIHTTMKKFLTKLPDNFLQVHRSFTINTSYLKSIEDNTIALTGGNLIPLGVSYRKDIFKKLNLS